MMYLDYDEFKDLIKKVDDGKITYEEALKYYTLDEDMKLIVLKLNYSDGKYSVSESTKIDYINPLKKYTTPFEYLLAFLIDGQDEKFVNDFINLILDTNIVITVMDESTEVITTVKTTTKVEGEMTQQNIFSGESNYSIPVNSTNVTSTTNVTKTYTTKIEPTYVNTWFVESYRKYNYKKEDSGPVSQGIETKTENYSNSSAMYTSTGTKTTSIETIVQTIRKYFEVASTETSDNTDVIIELFKRSQSARYNIMDDPSWLIDDLLAENENTADMVELTKYWLQKATGYDFGVDEFDFSIFDLGSFNSVSSGGLKDFIKEYVHYWEHSTPPPTNADGTCYIIEDDGYGHPTVGYGVDIFNGGFASEFRQAGYSTSIGGEVPIEFVDAIEERELQENLDFVKSTTSGLNLKGYQIAALVSRCYNCGTSGALMTSRGSPAMNFVNSYTTYWNESDDLYEAKDMNANFNHLLYTNYMSKPNTSNGVVSNGLIRRRKSEWILFQSGYADVLDKWFSASGGDILEVADRCWKWVCENRPSYAGCSIPPSRTVDCSGFVTWVLYEMGYTDFSYQWNTQMYINNQEQLKNKYGWEIIPISSNENISNIVQPGDIIDRSVGAGGDGHMNIAVSCENGVLMAYDCGNVKNWTERANGGNPIDRSYFLTDSRPGIIIRGVNKP